VKRARGRNGKIIKGIKAKKVGVDNFFRMWHIWGLEAFGKAKNTPVPPDGVTMVRHFDKLSASLCSTTMDDLPRRTAKDFSFLRLRRPPIFFCRLAAFSCC